MPHRARLIAGTVLSLFLSGCAHWPGPEHRAVTLDGIQALLEQQASRSQPLSEPEPDPVQCLDLSGFEEQLEGQRLQLGRISKQMQNLTAATPAFVNSSCPPETPAAFYDGKLVVGASEWIYPVRGPQGRQGRGGGRHGGYRPPEASPSGRRGRDHQA